MEYIGRSAQDSSPSAPLRKDRRPPSAFSCVCRADRNGMTVITDSILFANSRCLALRVEYAVLASYAS
ncbi:hypothetical protein E2P81_ATG07428 [Venturia nashicola]|nr:hypothetical protein E2P81_ATG07428 [Venturia nashicola]